MVRIGHKHPRAIRRFPWINVPLKANGTRDPRYRNARHDAGPRLYHHIVIEDQRETKQPNRHQARRRA
jgi:hypothetical protein